MAGGFDTPSALAKALAKASSEMRELDAASAEIGSLVVHVSRRMVPVRSGRLRSSIAFRVGKSKKFDSVVTISAGGARAPYAPVIQFGWPARHIRPNKFLLHALDRVDQQGFIEQTYADRIQKILTDAIK